MTICTVTGWACNCQPDEGIPCNGLADLRLACAQWRTRAETAETELPELAELRRAVYTRTGLEAAVAKHFPDLALVAKAEIASLRADAMRYRWLREQRRWYHSKPPTPGISVRWENLIAGPADWLDAAIDACALNSEADQ